MFMPSNSAWERVKGLQDQGNIPEHISWPTYIRIEFMPGKRNGDPDQNRFTAHP